MNRVGIQLCSIALLSCLMACAGQKAPTPTPDVPDPGALTPQEQATLEKACETLRAEHREVVGKASVADPKLRAELVDSGTCVVSGRAAWATVLTELTAKPGELPDTIKTSGTRHIVHIQADGTRTTLTPGPGGELFSSAGKATGNNVETGVYHTDEYALEVFDFDGDTQPEALITVRFSGHESASSESTTIATFANGTIAPYAPWARYEGVERVEDVDGDGRPDLLLESPWSIPEPGTMDGSLTGPRFLAISMPDGTFDMKAPVAELFMRGQCQLWRQGWHHGYLSLSPWPMDDELNNEPFRAVLWGVACARIFGYSKDAVAKELEQTALKRNFAEGLVFGEEVAEAWNAVEPPATYKP